jgi:serine/threonine-protein kinase
MPQVRYQSLGSLHSGEGSRAVLGLALEEGVPARPVALVWAPPEVVQDAELTAKLARETQRAVVFEHPNILRVHGLVALEGGLARVTEYADGELLRRVLEAGKRLPPSFAALVVADAAMGVHYAHLAGNDDGTPLVHGDLRPETLMVTFGGVCQVTGYGALGVAPKEPHGRRVLNRRRYSAPEQLLGGREALNIQTDVFLLGLVLYECLTGKIPFKDTPDPDKATLTRPLPPLPAEVSRALEAVVHKATAKRANERYPSALAFREAVVAAAGTLPSRELFAAHLSRLFPPEGEVRLARRLLLDKGLAELRQGTGAPVATPAPAPAASVAVAPSPVAVPPAPSPASPPASASGAQVNTAPPPRAAEVPPERPAPLRAKPEEEDEAPAPRRPRWLVPFAAAGLLLALAAGAFMQRRGVELPEATAIAVADAGDAPPTDAGETLAAVVADAGLAVADAGAPLDAGTTGALAVAPSRIDPGALLELFVEPQVNVSIEGRVLGRTPLSVALPPGRHVLYLNNPALGIQTARAVTLSPTERNLHEIQLRKGFVNVRAPRGSAIILDGRHVGTAPIEQLALYEGPHRLLVTLGGENWEQSFQLEGHQHVTFTVNFEEP